MREVFDGCSRFDKLKANNSSGCDYTHNEKQHEQPFEPKSHSVGSRIVCGRDHSLRQRAGGGTRCGSLILVEVDWCGLIGALKSGELLETDWETES